MIILIWSRFFKLFPASPPKNIAIQAIIYFKLLWVPISFLEIDLITRNATIDFPNINQWKYNGSLEIIYPSKTNLKTRLIGKNFYTFFFFGLIKENLKSWIRKKTKPSLKIGISEQSSSSEIPKKLNIFFQRIPFLKFCNEYEFHLEFFKALFWFDITFNLLEENTFLISDFKNDGLWLWKEKGNWNIYFVKCLFKNNYI